MLDKGKHGFGAGKGERRYNKVKNGAKNSEGSKISSGGGATRRGGEGRLPPGEPPQRRRCAVRTAFGRVGPCQAKVKKKGLKVSGLSNLFKLSLVIFNLFLNSTMQYFSNGSCAFNHFLEQLLNLIRHTNSIQIHPKNPFIRQNRF